MISRIRKLVYGLLGLVVFLLVLVGVADNSSRVPLTYLDYTTPSLSIAWWILIAFAIGLVLGYVMSLEPRVRGRMDVRKTRKQLVQKERELSSVRANAEESEKVQN